MANYGIVAILNQYRDILNDLIDSSDPESSYPAGPIAKKSRNTPMSDGNLADLSKGDCLDENLSNRSSRLAPKAENLQICQEHVVALWEWYAKTHRRGKDCWRNKINPGVEGKRDIEASVYHYGIDLY